MREKNKPSNDPRNNPRCAAIKRFRMAAGWSQEQLAQITGISTQNISRFELGKAIPHDVAVLVALRKAAKAAHATTPEFGDESQVFDDAISEELGTLATPAEIEAITTATKQVMIDAPSPRVWRMIQIARIAAKYFPLDAREMEAAGGQALAVVNEIIAAAPPPDAADTRFYAELERQLDALAAKKVFAALQEGSR
jgi:transcriptional regulator with XRE-family HTH domain